MSFPIVGIGASAGGLEAFTQLLKNLPTDTGMAFVLVQHLDPDHASALTELLSRVTALPVREVTNDLALAMNHVYVIPPNTTLSIAGGTLKLRQRSQARLPHKVIDAFLESLAEDQKERAIGVILSGTASDGTLGLEAIKAEGGLTFAQDDSARYDSMPRSAIAAGCVDFVLGPEAIARELGRIARHPLVTGRAADLRSSTAGDADRDAGSARARRSSLADARLARDEAGATPTGNDDSGFRRILLLLRNHNGVDFSLYRSTTILRRIARRMVLSRQGTLADYAGFLRGNATELDALYADVLISVTSFFRNPEAFDVLQRKVFPKLLQQRGDDAPRAWVLGCSTGQEAYSVAMAFMETAEKTSRMRRLQVFATDLNDALLEKARQGLYARSIAQDISPERLRRFFVEEEGGYRVSKALRETVVFARQNLISDPPFSRMDLVCCRNLLIYLEPALQQKALPTFHYALKPQGFLFLGVSESIAGFTDLFEPVDKKSKIYSRKAAPTPAFHLPVRTARGEDAPRPPAPQVGAARRNGEQEVPERVQGDLNSQREADRVTVNKYAPPGVLVNADLQILQFRGQTSAYLEPPTGRASFDVLKMAREGLALPLRAAINKANKQNKTIRAENLRIKRHGAVQRVNIEVIPLKNLRERCLLILFEDAQNAAPAASPPADEPAGAAARKSRPAARREDAGRIAELERELAETRDYLQSLQEQHEASTEELQASNEEVQSANEELQSINEELETSKEELESTNEELTTVNEEMSNRNIELNRLNGDMVNLQTSMHQAIVLLGRDLTIRRFSQQAEQKFNLLAADVGRPVGGMRHDLDMAGLEELAIEVIDSVRECEREVRDRQGRWYSLRIRPYLTLDNKVDGAVLILVDIDALKRTELAARDAREQAQAIIRTTPDPLVVLDAALRVTETNDAYYRAFNTTRAEVEGHPFFALDGGAWNIPALRQRLEDILPHGSFFSDLEVTPTFRQLGARTLLLNARTLKDASNRPRQVFLGMRDITEILALQAKIRRSEIRYRQLFETARDGVLILDLATRKIVDANPFMTELLGYAREELLGKELFELGLAKDRAATEQSFRRLLAEGVVRYDDLPLETKAGTLRHVEFISNVFSSDGDRVVQCNIRDVTARREDDEERARLAAIVESSDDAIVGKDIDGIIMTWNRGAERLFGYTAREAVGQPVMMLIPPDRKDEEASILERIRRGQSIASFDTVRCRKDGTPVDVSLTLSPVRDGRGRIVGASEVARDIGERKRNEKQRDLLMGELDHRVKNALATVQSIVRQSSRNAASLDDFLQSFEGRLLSMAQTHNLLNTERWRNVSLRRIVTAELSPYGSGEGGRIAIAGEDVGLDSKQVLIVGLALHELATNAAKYGALSVPTGRVEVSWNVRAAGDGPVLRFQWVESGGPAVEAPSRRGFGSQLIERGLRHELQADVDLDFRREGVRFSMQVPLESRES